MRSPKLLCNIFFTPELLNSQQALTLTFRSITNLVFVKSWRLLLICYCWSSIFSSHFLSKELGICEVIMVDGRSGIFFQTTHLPWISSNNGSWYIWISFMSILDISQPDTCALEIVRPIEDCQYLLWNWTTCHTIHFVGEFYYFSSDKQYTTWSVSRA